MSARDGVTMEQIGLARRSKCCAATIHAEDGEPDFAGRVEGPRAVTCWFVCDACGLPCDTTEIHPDRASSSTPPAAGDASTSKQTQRPEEDR